MTITLLSVFNENMNRTNAAMEVTPIVTLEVLYISVLFQKRSIQERADDSSDYVHSAEEPRVVSVKSIVV